MTENGGNGMFNMPVVPAYGFGGGMGGGFGNGFGGDGWWLILLILLCGNGLWGNNGGGFGGGNGGAGTLYPWMNQSNQMNDGFQNQLLNDNITSIRDGVFGLSTQLCNGFSGVNATVANSFAQAEIAANARQMADMNQNFALQSQLSQCCCDNRLATCQTQNLVQNDGALTRQAIQQQTQSILDKLCALELDGVKNQLAAAQRENVGLQNQLNMANLAASQTAQTVNIRDSIIDELRSCPIPSQPVYGSQPIFTCPNNNCGCGCGA